MSSWQPTQIIRHIRSIPTEAQAIEVETDAGRGFLKGLGNPAGPHALACEWLGTKLATWLGLQTFDHALIDVAENDELPMSDGAMVLPGPAFITRAEKGTTWGGGDTSLDWIQNAHDISRLVVFDTWTLNCDRYTPANGKARDHPDNVFLSRENASGRNLRLVAMDHTHCFTCGGELTTRLSQISYIQDPTVYGVFPSFERKLVPEQVRVAANRLKSISPEEIAAHLAILPEAWEVGASVRLAWRELIVRRAAYVAKTIIPALFKQGDLCL